MSGHRKYQIHLGAGSEGRAKQITDYLLEDPGPSSILGMGYSPSTGIMEIRMLGKLGESMTGKRLMEKYRCRLVMERNDEKSRF